MATTASAARRVDRLVRPRVPGSLQRLADQVLEEAALLVTFPRCRSLARVALAWGAFARAAPCSEGRVPFRGRLVGHGAGRELLVDQPGVLRILNHQSLAPQHVLEDLALGAGHAA